MHPANAFANIWTTVLGRPMYGRTSRLPARGVPIVLVHGLGVSSTYLMPTAIRLAPFHPVFLPDLPGFGRSAKPSHILNIQELTDALAGWMNAHGLRDVYLVGNSLGCQFIVDLAMRYPRLVRGGVLVGPTIDPEARSVLSQVLRGALDLFREPLAYWPLLFHDYLLAGPIRTLMTLYYAVHDPVVPKLPHIHVPMLVVRGGNDPIAPQRWVEQMARLLPRGESLVIPGTAHVANYTTPDILARAVRSFVSRTLIPATVNLQAHGRPAVGLQIPR